LKIRLNGVKWTHVSVGTKIVVVVVVVVAVAVPVVSTGVAGATGVDILSAAEANENARVRDHNAKFIQELRGLHSVAL
jgi:hypothetical protein